MIGRVNIAGVGKPRSQLVVSTGGSLGARMYVLYRGIDFEDGLMSIGRPYPGVQMTIAPSDQLWKSCNFRAERVFIRWIWIRVATYVSGPCDGGSDWLRGEWIGSQRQSKLRHKRAGPGHEQTAH